MDFDPNKLIGDVDKPKFELPKRNQAEPVAGPELHRLTELHVKCSSPECLPFRRAVLSEKWVKFYSQFDNTAWVTEELYKAAKAWGKVAKLRWAPGTFDLWLDEEYADWAEKQQNRVLSNERQISGAEALKARTKAVEAAKAAEKALVDEFHKLPNYEQKQFRDDTIEILLGRCSKLPPSWVVEVNAAKLWQSRKKG